MLKRFVGLHKIFIYIYPVCLSQHLYFYKNKLLVFEKLHNYGFDTVSTILGRKLWVLKNVITSVHLIRGKNGCLVSLSGWGGCDWCTVYTEIFDFKGKSLLMQLEDRTKVYKKYGDYKKICNTYDIPQSYNEQKEIDDGFFKRIDPLKMAEKED